MNSGNSGNSGQGKGSWRSGGNRRRRRKGSKSGSQGFRPQGNPRPNRQRGGGFQPQAQAAGQDVQVVDLEPVAGVLETHPQGYGFLRDPKFDFTARPGDVYISINIVRKYGLEPGSWIEGEAGVTSGRENQRAMKVIQKVDGVDPDSPEARSRIPFKDLTVLDPLEKLRLSDGFQDPSLRLLDLLTPIGKGQRGLIVAPPRTGKTILLQKVAQAITKNHPEVHLMVVLVDERPEEATDWKRTVEGEVLSSTSDLMASSHVNVAEIAISRAKRMVEMKKDVVILLDSLTRLGRAYNTETKNSGRTLSGGLDARTLEKPKGFFGAARNAEEGGSLTILATALIETGSRMDEVIFEEFKGTGNMELVLSRKLADQRIFPAIDFHLSGTRKEEKLLDPSVLKSVWTLRRVLQKVNPVEGTRLLIKKLSATKSNEDFLKTFTPVED